MSLNQVTLTGRLVRDPTYYEAPKPRALFTIAVDRWGEGADFIGVTAFGAQATALAENTAKGHLIAVDGRVSAGSYEDETGKTIYTTQIVANSIEFLARPKTTDQRAAEKLLERSQNRTMAAELAERSEARAAEQSLSVEPDAAVELAQPGLQRAF